MHQCSSKLGADQADSLKTGRCHSCARYDLFLWIRDIRKGYVTQKWATWQLGMPGWKQMTDLLGCQVVLYSSNLNAREGIDGLPPPGHFSFFEYFQH